MKILSNVNNLDRISDGDTYKKVSSTEKTTWNNKQDKLTSGTNIKTVNGNSLLGSGNITISGGGSADDVTTRLNSDNETEVIGIYTTQNSARKIWEGTKAQYDAITTKDANTYYYITDDKVSFNDLSDKPTIPSKTSDLTNDSGFITSSYHDTTKQDKLSTQTAYSAKGSATKVPQITTNNLGQVTGITEVTITQPDISGKENTSNKSSSYTTSSTTTYPNTKALVDGLATKQDKLTSGTNIKTVNNTTLLGSGNISVQPTLVSGTNIKTVNGNSLLGSGNIEIQGGGGDVPTIPYDVFMLPDGEEQDSAATIAAFGGLENLEKIIDAMDNNQPVCTSIAESGSSGELKYTTAIVEYMIYKLYGSFTEYGILCLQPASADVSLIMVTLGKIETDPVEYTCMRDSSSDRNIQEKLVSGTNIKTINNQSLLGSGNITIGGSDDTIYVSYGIFDLTSVSTSQEIIEAFGGIDVINKLLSSTTEINVLLYGEIDDGGEKLSSTMSPALIAHMTVEGVVAISISSVYFGNAVSTLIGKVGDEFFIAERTKGSIMTNASIHNIYSYRNDEVYSCAYINEVISKGYASAFRTSNQSLTANTTNVINLTSITGDTSKFSISGGGIKILSDTIKCIMVDCSFIFDGSYSGTYFFINKNGSAVKRIINTPATHDFEMCCIIPVQKNDVITMSCYMFSSAQVEGNGVESQRVSMRVAGL